MKNLKTVFASLFITGLALLTSCDPNESVEISQEVKIPPTMEAFQNIREQALENNTQTFQFDGNDGNITLTSDNGVQININTNCLTLNGNPVSGTVDLKYVELFEKGNMLTTHKPTMGELPNGDKALLISGGEFLLEATQGGIALNTNCNIQLVVPNSLTGGADPAMTLWEGTIDNEENLTWDEVEDATGQGGVFVEGGEYYAFLGQFGWSNIDRFYNDPRPKTLIKAQAPVGYNFTNSAIYLSYDGEDSGLASLDTYDGTLNLFSEHYGQIPIGLECHVIFATEDNGVWRYAVKPVTIVADDIISFNFNETALATEAEFVNIINALP
ncbi:hypothetical protein CLV86_2474 [Lacinutrix venerupis]|uniref:hypothetical protein n=1 Tax=Lacinutrix venerupis TaxID=1486034 RepID=UPI000EAB76A1|nr:hypothetical protein [Lacinutrix venerupis]RLJ61454.1 hypothetical protein CLV86_2474 [Lacinutrix venerupis]